MPKHHRMDRLLSTLGPEDFAYLEPHLEIIKLKGRQVLCETGEPLNYAYFPHDTVVSLLAVMEDGGSVEVSLCGREGVLGLLNGAVTRASFGRYIVQVPGTASRISLDRLYAAINPRPNIQQLMRHFSEVAMLRILQNVACNALHSVEARCCRWMLILSDRLDHEVLPLTHEFLASVLGVQRSMVSTTTRALQAAGLIRQCRGGIAVVDRAGLEAAACECYDRICHSFERLLPHSSARV